jgi:PGF-pre-PGF domain-containing protein
VTHTEVESVTRYAPAGPAAGEEFEVTLRISYSELPLVVGIVETIPEGFTFVSCPTHPSDQYEVSGQKVAFTAICKEGEVEIKEIKYKVIAPSSGDGTFTGEWIDLLVLTTELEEGKEGRWHTVAPEEGTTVIIGGGGAGTIDEGVTATPTPTPFVPAVTKASRVIPVMEAGKEVAMVFEDMDVRLIALKADKNVSDAKVVVERVEKSAEIPEPSGIGYIYLDVEVENAGDAKIEGRIEFKVANSWIADNSIDEATVTLSRYEGGGWKTLPTSKVGEDNATVYFEAQTPGFSTFAITGEKKVVVEATAATPTPTVAAPTPATTATPSPTPSSSEEVPGFEAIFAAVSLAVAYLVVFRKKEKGGR